MVIYAPNFVRHGLPRNHVRLCTLGFGSSRAFRVLHLNIAVFKSDSYLPFRRRNWRRRAPTVASAELDEQYKRLRRVDGHCLAHKAQWHGFQPICIAKSLSAVRCSQRTSDCYEVNRVSVSPATRSSWVPSNRVQRGERRYGRDALSNPSGGRVVAKANEADCIAQTPKSKHVRKGEVAFKVLNVHFCRGRTYTHSKFLLVRFQ